MEAYAAIEERTSIAGVKKIPVVFHVVYKNSKLNLSNDVIQDQINILNENFRAKNSDLSHVPSAFRKLIADTEIEFGFARRDPFGRPTNGVTRKRTSVDVFPQKAPQRGQSASAQIAKEVMSKDKGTEGWPRDHYMNVWICDMGLSPLGFATYPGVAEWDDCIVVDVRAFGRHREADGQYNLGRTLVHEAGHWLNLIHLWGDENLGCKSTDNVNDTPVQFKHNEGTPSYPSISCNNGPHGDLFMNFMDIVDDSAMVMFTEGQKKRMRVALKGPRRSLLRGWAFKDPITKVSGKRFSEINTLSDTMTLTTLLKAKGMPSSPMIFDGVSWVNSVE